MSNGFRAGLIVGLLALGVVGSQGLYTVNEGERGVVVTFGKVVGVAGPGTNWKLPFFTDVKNFSVRDQVVLFEGLEAYTHDQQTATLTGVSVNFRISPEQVEQVYLNYGTQDNLVAQTITRRLGENLEKVFGQYTSERTVQQRSQLGIDVATIVKDVGAAPIQVTSVQVEGISYSADYEAAIAQRMQAEVEVRRLEEQAKQAEVNARITVTQAQATADARLAEATANAEAVRLQGDAEADAIRAKSAALSQNPALIELTKAERWDGVLPTTVLPNSTVPFIDAVPTAPVK